MSERITEEQINSMEVSEMQDAIRRLQRELAERQAEYDRGVAGYAGQITEQGQRVEALQQECKRRALEMSERG